MTYNCIGELNRKLSINSIKWNYIIVIILIKIRGENMRFNRLFGLLFTIIFIIILYVIIFLALKIMYKDVKNGGRKKKLKKSLGLEVEDPGENNSLKKGSVIPIRGPITIGRAVDNNVILSDQYVSGSHAKFYVKNDNYFLQDLKSTNGTMLNGVKVNGAIEVQVGDEIKIGTVTFRVIG